MSLKLSPKFNILIGMCFYFIKVDAFNLNFNSLTIIVFYNS